MKSLLLVAVTFAFPVAFFTSCSDVPAEQIPPIKTKSLTQSKKTMRPFRSEQELIGYLKELAAKQKLRQRQEAQQSGVAGAAADAPAPPAAGKGVGLPSKGDESITNVQHAGVDEGGIVKLHGGHLIVLRRGRLFTVAIADNALKPISTVDAFGPDIDPRLTWYDEMLVSEETVAVIGYNYERGGTEVGLFSIDRAGQLTYRSTYHLRSNDYYSSRNYASRLIDGKLIFYTPQYFWPGTEHPLQSFPSVRKWRKGATEMEFRRIVNATRVYRPEREFIPRYNLALHTVTVCDLRNSGFSCEATAVVGPPGRVFYVSPESIYVWVSDWSLRDEKMRAESMLYRMPLDGSAPSALSVSGSPVDQFSFLEGEDAHLNVLVRSDSVGDAMWGPEVAEGDVGLMRVPLASFSDGSEAVSVSNYRKLPKPEGYTFQNRFVGDYLLYGTGSGWGRPQPAKQSSVFAVRWSGGDVRSLSLTHGVDRIEAMGPDAVVVGTNGQDLTFTAVRLGTWPDLGGRYTRKGAGQGELRSHGFFYKSDGNDSGTLGLPISLPGRPGYEHLFESSAAILFLRNKSLQFEEIGELAARAEKAVDDACQASCIDWYGNARPLFVRGRVLALLGYELVEGRLAEGRMREVQRVSYAPTPQQVTRR